MYGETATPTDALHANVNLFYWFQLNWVENASLFRRITQCHLFGELCGRTLSRRCISKRRHGTLRFNDSLGVCSRSSSGKALSGNTIDVHLRESLECGRAGNKALEMETWCFWNWFSITPFTEVQRLERGRFTAAKVSPLSEWTFPITLIDFRENIRSAATAAAGQFPNPFLWLTAVTSSSNDA